MSATARVADVAFDTVDKLLIAKPSRAMATRQRRGIADATANIQLSSIFGKSGTHWQAELVRLLVDAAKAKEVQWANNERSRDSSPLPRLGRS